MSHLDRKFGIEIEMYNVDSNRLSRELNAAGISCTIEGYNHNTRNHWKIVSDGSIEGQNCLELVSPVLQGENGLQQIEKVCGVLKRMNAYINKSCGLHVHFDAQNFDLRQWKNIYKNYAGFENQIDELMPTSRRANNNYYCRSLKSISILTAKIDAATNLAAIENVFTNNRYFRINPTSYRRHNTLEFRQHRGTIEYSKISNWLVFLHNLVDYSKNHLATDFSWNGITSINQVVQRRYVFHSRLKN